MCSPAIDCKFCPTIEVCPRVRAAFPTEEEERSGLGANILSRKRNAAARGSKPPGTCNARGCMQKRKAHSSLCDEHDREYHRQWRADHPDRVKQDGDKRTRRLQQMRQNDPAAYQKYLERKRRNRQAEKERKAHA